MSRLYSIGMGFGGGTARPSCSAPPIHTSVRRSAIRGSVRYALGDSPLVLLTALQSVFEPDPSSSRYVERPTPALGDDGAYSDVADGRPMRVYTWVDTRLMFEDMYLKLAEFERWQGGVS